jgi:hypothetical protein
VERITAWIKRLGQPTDVPVAPAPEEAAPRDYTREREVTRSGQLSAEEQAWEADTRQRDRAAHQRPQVEDWESEGGAGAVGTRSPRDGER